MTPLPRLGADDLRAVVAGFRDALRAHKEAINRLNVYPVPDGDTGSNMALTLESVAAELDEIGSDLPAVCKAVGHGALMGARGNSGVILSQILRGMTQTFAAAPDGAIDGAVFTESLRVATAGAYEAVGNPVEGTILTVIRECAEGAAAAGEGADLVTVLDAARTSGYDALARTPELLPVLAAAGVVDAGGTGLMLLMDAFLLVADGRPMPEASVTEAVADAGHVEDLQILAHGDQGHVGGLADLRYEVMYLLEAPDEAIGAFKDVWAGIGDSIVVVGGDGLWNCHIHTDDIGPAIEAAIEIGKPSKIRVTDLLEEVEEERWVREAETDPEPDLEPVTTAVVAIATGEGIRRIFHSLGARVLTGGQSMNPSTQQILEAVEAANADQVVILPNNKNIVAVAEQVDATTAKTVKVVPTKGIPEGFAALMAYDPDADLDTNAADMADAAANVAAGEVTRAVRDSTCDVGPIAEGDFLGIARDGIFAVAPTAAEAVIGLLEHLLDDDHEIITLIEGDGATDAETRKVKLWVDEHRDGVEVETHHGGQPLYPYLIGLEVSDGPISYAELAGYPLTAIAALAAKPKKVAGLHALGVHDVLDLVTYYPRRHIDRSKQLPIRSLVPGDEALVVGKVVRVSSRRTRGPPSKLLVTVDVTDGAGHLRLTFFNQWHIERILEAGTEAAFFGKVDTYQGRLQMSSPVVDVIGGDQTGRVISLYPQSDKHGIGSAEVATWVAAALAKTTKRGLADPLPEEVRRRLGLVDRASALRGYHVPETFADIAVARKRLVFDELLRVQLALVLRKRALERTARGIAHDGTGELVGRFHAALPYPLTAAQQRVIAEIRADLAGPHPMHRLLQGDVGAGKTVVALSALLVAVEGGHQGALMAPTEVLAEQHAAGIRALLDGLTVPGDADEGSLFEGFATERPVRVELLTNRTPAAARRKLAAALEVGEVDLLVGTHALIEDKVAFRSLGVVVIDEQHRFGVEQRAALRDKGAEGATPDVLVMTATPIPRTAAMTVYGDLDVSVLDELPPGRTPIDTRWVRANGSGDDPAAEEPVWDHVRAEVAAGRQAYVVCPLVEGSDKLEVSSAEETFERLGGGELHGLRLGLLHGRMSSADKDATMGRFRARDLDVLVATTVIEVGVDVPNATVMVILDADRFGIAQLHQLRGRVGRGAQASTCWLVGAGATPDGQARLEAMVRTTDGFELAEVDLELRGEGTLMGERQKGRNDLKLASLRRDREWVERAREVAFELVDADPDLAHHRDLSDEVALFLGEDDADFLLKS